MKVMYGYNKLIWYYLLNYASERNFNNLACNIGVSRIRKYTLYAFLLLMFISCLTIKEICPNNICKNRSMASYYYELYQYNETTNTSEQVLDISHFYVILDTMYVTLYIFSGTGFGNIKPQSRNMLILHTFCALLSRIVVGLVIGLSRDIAESAIESFHSEYTIVRNRIKHMLCKLKIQNFYQDYVTGYIDANYLRCHNNDFRDHLQGQITPAVLSDLFYDFIGKNKIENMHLFKGISKSCLREILAKATILENYFSGHLIQTQGSPLDGIIMIITGNIIIGKRNLAMEGECIFSHHFYSDRTYIAECNVYAFTRSEIVKLKKNVVMHIFKYYPKDEVIFKRNIQISRVHSGTNLVTRYNIKQYRESKKKWTSLANKAARKARSVFRGNSIRPVLRRRPTLQRREESDDDN
jgi:hypothetical protein